MPKKNKNLDFANTRRTFITHIDVWLQEVAAAKEEMDSCEAGSSMWSSAWDRQEKYSAVAHALVMLGRNVGVISADEYPQLPG